jgi:hypothetical protein
MLSEFEEQHPGTNFMKLGQCLCNLAFVKTFSCHNVTEIYSVAYENRRLEYCYSGHQELVKPLLVSTSSYECCLLQTLVL